MGRRASIEGRESAATRGFTVNIGCSLTHFPAQSSNEACPNWALSGRHGTPSAFRIAEACAIGPARLESVQNPNTEA
jgi:hypothetical protein